MPPIGIGQTEGVFLLLNSVQLPGTLHMYVVGWLLADISEQIDIRSVLKSDRPGPAGPGDRIRPGRRSRAPGFGRAGYLT